MSRWRVRRAYQDADYLFTYVEGWYAVHPWCPFLSRWFETWQEAMNYAYRQAAAEVNTPLFGTLNSGEFEALSNALFVQSREAQS